MRNLNNAKGKLLILELGIDPWDGFHGIA